MMRFVVLRIKAHAHQPHVLGERFVLRADRMKLIKYIGGIRTTLGRRTASINKTQHRDPSVGQLSKVYRFPTGIEQCAVRRRFDCRQRVAARRRRLVIVIAVTRKLVAGDESGSFAQENQCDEDWSKDHRNSKAPLFPNIYLLATVRLGPSFVEPKSMWC